MWPSTQQGYQVPTPRCEATARAKEFPHLPRQRRLPAPVERRQQRVDVHAVYFQMFELPELDQRPHRNGVICSEREAPQARRQSPSPDARDRHPVKP